MPCWASSATGRCSSGNDARRSVTCCLPGRSRFGFGRCGTSGGGVKCGRCRRSPCSPRRSPRRSSGRSPRRSPPAERPARCSPPRSRRRSPRSSGGRSRRGRRSPSSRRPGARCWTTGSNASSVGSSSSRSDRAAFSFGGTTDSTRMPSTSFSVSTRNWSPTSAPPGRIDPSSTPRGSRAPAARHVHEPSGDELVSSISMRMGMARHRTGSLRDGSNVLPVRSRRAHLRARRPGAGHRPDGLRPSRRSRHRVGAHRAGELGVAQRRPPRRRRRDPHRRPHQHPGLQRAAHHGRRPDRRRRRVRHRPHRPPRGVHRRGSGDGRQRRHRPAPLASSRPVPSSPPTPSCSHDVTVPPGALAVGAPATIKPDRARLDDILHSVGTYVARAERFRRELRRID